MRLCLAEQGGIDHIGLHKEAAERDEAADQGHQRLQAVLALHGGGQELDIQRRACGKFGEICFAIGANDRRCPLSIGAGSGGAICRQHLAGSSAVRGGKTLGRPLQLSAKGADTGREAITAYAVEGYTDVCKIRQKASRDGICLVIVVTVIDVSVQRVLAECLLTLPIVFQNVHKLAKADFFLIEHQLLDGVE